MATLGAELGCERYLASTVVTGSGQRSSTLLAELCLSTVLVLALLAFHCRPRRKKRARCTATVTSRMVDASPVTLPPGRFRLATRPNLTGSSLTPKTIGIVVVVAFAASEAKSRLAWR